MADVLVEREDYLISLERLLGEALDGSGRLVFLGGEAGVGKTALATALAEAASGPVVRRGSCDNVTTAEALGPILDALPELAVAADYALSTGTSQRWLSRLSWVLGQNADSERYAAAAVATLEPLGTSHELAMAYSNLAQLRMLADDATAAVRWGAKAMGLARGLGDREAEMHALNNVGTALSMAGDPIEGRARLTQSLDLALADDAHEHAARAYTNLGSSTVMRRSYREADQHLRAGIAYCTDRDLDTWRLYMSAWLARSLAEQGQYTGADQYLADIMRHPHLSPITLASALPVAGVLAARRGSDGTRELDEALPIAVQMGESQRLVPVASARAEAAWIAGRTSEVAAEIERAWPAAVVHPQPWDLGELCWWLHLAGEDRPTPAPVAQPFTPRTPMPRLRCTARLTDSSPTRSTPSPRGPDSRLRCRVVRHSAQHDAEVVPVRRQQRVVRVQLLLSPGPALGLDEHPAADRHPAAWNQPGADRAAGEVGQRRGLLPPARRDAVGERPLPGLESVLRPAVPENVDVSRVGVGEPEPAGRIVLVIPGVQQQRIVAVTAEAHVGEPRPAAVGRAHDERQMIERRAQARFPVDPGGDPAHLRAEGLEQQRESPVELIAEAAAATAHDLVDQVAFVQRDRLGQMNAQVLERHRQLVRTVQRAQARPVTNGRRGNAETVQIRHHGFVIHRSLRPYAAYGAGPGRG